MRRDAPRCAEMRRDRRDRRDAPRCAEIAEMRRDATRCAEMRQGLPSSTMSARVMRAKYSGTANGKSKKIWFRSREIAANWRRFDATALYSAARSPPRRRPPPPRLSLAWVAAARRPCSNTRRSGGSSASLSTSGGKKRSVIACARLEGVKGRGPHSHSREGAVCSRRRRVPRHRRASG